MLNLYHEELIGTTKEYEGKKYLMVNDYTVCNVLDKIKGIGIEQLDDIRILTDADDKLRDDTI